jgi:hypothetical protein
MPGMGLPHAQPQPPVAEKVELEEEKKQGGKRRRRNRALLEISFGISGGGI